jgi:hypothetical protein
MANCYIATNTIALYPDCLTSPSLSLRFSSQLPLPPPFAPPTLPAQFALLDRWGGWIIGSRLHCHPTLRPGEYDADPGIVAVSDIGRPVAKIPCDDRCEFCLAAPSDALRAHPGIRTSARGWTGRDGLPREVLPYEPARVSRTVQFYAAGQAAAGEGELSFVGYWPILT